MVGSNKPRIPRRAPQTHKKNKLQVRTSRASVLVRPIADLRTTIQTGMSGGGAENSQTTGCYGPTALDYNGGNQK